MAKTDASNKKGASKKADPIKAKPASSKEILAKAAALAKSTSKKLQQKTSSTSSDTSSDSSSSEESSSEESDSSESKKGTVSVKATPVAVQKAAESSHDSSSSEESSSEESDDNDKKKVSVPAKTSPTQVKKNSDSEDDSSATSSSEDSPSESEGDEDDGSSVQAQTDPAGVNKKRKADNEAAAPPKKAKLANGNAPVSTSGEETRSIFVGRLSWNVDNDWLAQEFAECGEVESAHVQMDRNTGRSRGFGYVHFKTAGAVEKAIALNGREIDGRAVNIDRSNPPDKQASAEKRAQAFGDTPSSPSTVLFVGNLSFGVNEDTLWETFGEHGDVKSVRVPTDRDTGKPKGFAYVEFSEIGAAKKAYTALQSFEFDGRSIRLDYSQPRDSAGGRGSGQGSRGGRGRGGFGGDRGGFGGDRGGFGGDRGGFGGDRGGFGGDRGGFGGDRGRGGGRGGRGGRGGDRGGGRGRGRGARTGGITQFEGRKITF